MGDILKAILKSKATKRLMLVIILVVVVTVIILPSQYVVTLDEGTYKEEDKSNAPYVVSEEIYDALSEGTSSESDEINVTVSKDGGFKLDIDLDDMVESIIETLDENGGNLDTYLTPKNKEEILKKMIKAELITQYPDLRYTNQIGTKTRDKSEFQGVIKFIRHKSDNTTQTLQYIPLGDEDSTNPGTLYGMINHVNNGGTIPNKTEITYFDGVDEDDYSKIFYIGDSWMKALKQQDITASKNGYFEVQEGGTAASSKFNNVNVKNNASAIVVMLGLNDPTTQEDMKNLIKELAEDEDNSDKIIYVLKVFHVGKEFVSSEGETASVYNSKIDVYNNDISEYCSTLENVKFVDATSGLIDSEGYLSETYKDGEYHLNTAGYEKLYENIKSLVEGKWVTTDVKLEGDSVLDYFSLDSAGNLIVATYSETITKEIEGTYSTEYKDSEKDMSEHYFNIEKKILDNTPTTVEAKYTTKEIRYKTVISNYMMPFNYLWDFLVAGRDEQFVSDLADLVLESKIEVSIYDFSNMSEGATIESHNVNEWELTSRYTRKWVNGEVEEYIKGEWLDSEAEITTTRHYTMNYTKGYNNSIAYVAPTYVDIWYMTQTAEYKYEKSETYNEWEITRLTEADEEFQPNNELINSAGEWEVLMEEPLPDTVEGTTTTTIVEYNDYTKKQTKNNQYMSASFSSSESCKYTLDGDPVVTEKTDKTLKKGQDGYPNFCTLFLESESARNNIIGAESWLFEILQNNQTTVNMVDLTKYLLYCAVDLDYGVTEYDLEIFNIIDFTKPKAGAMQLLIDYIHYWEAGGVDAKPPMNADGTMYIVHDDGAGHPTVGYGVDIYNCGYADLFISSGYDLSIGSEIDIDFVDSIEELELEAKIEGVEAEVEGLGLTGYQINALVSRAYNAGTYGAVGQYRNGKNFEQAYTAYWKEEDDKFQDLKEAYDEAEEKYEEEKQKHGETSTECQQALNAFEEVKDGIAGDYSHKLYSTYMDEPVTSNGDYLPGLATRRKSEWTLFQTGYYDVLDKWHSDGGALLEAAYAVGEYFNQYTIHYAGNDVAGANKNGRSCVWTGSIQDAYDLPVKYPGSYGFVCATYVGFALWKSGLCTEEEISSINFNLADTIVALLISKGWQIVEFSEMQPGDVAFMKGHIAIYAGDGYYIDQSYCVISSWGYDTRGNLVRASESGFFYALRCTY